MECKSCRRSIPLKGRSNVPDGLRGFCSSCIDNMLDYLSRQYYSDKSKGDIMSVIISEVRNRK